MRGGMTGVTEMPCLDDYGPDETFTQADGTAVPNWTASEGISKPTGYFSNTFEPSASG